MSEEGGGGVRECPREKQRKRVRERERERERNTKIGECVRESMNVGACKGHMTHCGGV